MTFLLGTGIAKETMGLAIKGHSEQKLCTVFENCFNKKPFFSFGLYCVIRILGDGHEEKVNRFMDYLRSRKERNMKKGEPFFLLSFLQHPQAMLNNGLFKPIVYFPIAKSLFDNGHCVTIFFL